MRALRVETLLREVMPPRSEEESESADDESTDESKDE